MDGAKKEKTFELHDITKNERGHKGSHDGQAYFAYVNTLIASKSLASTEQLTKS